MLAQRREHSCSTPSAPAADEHPRREAAAWSEAGVGVGPSVRLVVAGSSTRCSQKIHSQRAGAAAAAPGAAFLLFLDDDVWVHAGTLHTLVAAFSARRQVRARRAPPRMDARGCEGPPSVGLNLLPAAACVGRSLSW